VEAPKASKKQSAWGVAAPSESTWGATLAICVTIAIHLLLPERFIIIPRWVLPTVLAVMLVPLRIIAPVRLPRESKWRQAIAIAVAAIVTLMNAVNLVMLAFVIVENRVKVDGAELIVAAVGIWVTNVIVFALWYWELDRGGPDDRLSGEHREPDFLFPQMVTPACARPGWSPLFLDYLYVSFTNATAFSPTDTMPLTPLAKMLFLMQALISLLTITFVAARAVNILS
jgi:uncharacterized membrane protein